jgi:hypothetical protein
VSRWRRSVPTVVAGTVLGVALALTSRHRERPRSGESHAPSPSLGASGRQIPPPATLGAPSRHDQTLELHPDAPGYDPSRFAGVIALSTVFDREPRVERWAKPMETYLADRIGTELARLIPGVALRHVECRTATCAVMLDRIAGDVGAAVKPAVVRQMLAVLYSPAAGEHFQQEELGFVLVYRGTPWLPDVSRDDPDQLISAIERRRAAVLEKIRRQRASGQPIDYVALDPSILPER